MFKKGDTVECIYREEGWSIESGKTYEVLSVSSDNRWVEIFLPQAKNQSYHYSRFKLVETKMSEVEKKREELTKAIKVLQQYDANIAVHKDKSIFVSKTLKDYSAFDLNLEGLLEYLVPDPKQDEIERIESEMRKLADDLAKLRG